MCMVFFFKWNRHLLVKYCSVTADLCEWSVIIDLQEWSTGLAFLKRTCRILLINWYWKMLFVKLPSKNQILRTILCGCKTGAALTFMRYRFPSKVKYGCRHLHRSADSILRRLTAHPVPFDQVMLLNVLKAAKVKFCYPKGMQNPQRSPSYCWPVSSSLARVETTCSLHCVSCWKRELAEIAVLLPDGEEQCQFPADTSSPWNGYSPVGESGNVQCWLWWKSEINVLIHIWVKKKKQGKLGFFFWDTSDFYKMI